MKTNDLLINFIGIGSPKSGTTWITQCLSEHPEINFSSLKETEFFMPHNFSKGNSWYKKFFQQKKGIKGEWSNRYLYSSETPLNIKNHSPNAKLILCLRNPIDRLISAYYFEFSKGIGNFRNVKEKYQKENSHNKERGLYYKYLKKFLDEFPPEKILILIYEDIEKNPQKFLKKIFNFLEVNENFITPSLNKKTNVTVKSKYKFKKMNILTYKFHKRFIKNTFTKKFIPFFKYIHINTLINSFLNFNKKKPEDLKPVKKDLLNKNERKELRKYYEYDIQSLENLLNRKLDFWK